MKNLTFFTILICLSWNSTSAQTLSIQSAVASSQESQNPVGNMFDGDMNTRWSGSGIGVTATMDLGTVTNFDRLRLAFHNSDARWTRFYLEVSDDGNSWSSISGTTYQSTAGTPLLDFEVFDLPNQYARFIRYTGQGNQQNEWSSIREIEVVNASFSNDSNSGVDTQNPTAPSLTSNGQSENTVIIYWSGATDNIGVTGYKIYRDNAVEATLGNISSYQVTGLLASTTYQFKIKALDAAGNESADSNIVSVTTDSSSGNGGSLGNGSVWIENSSVASYNGNVAVGRSSVPPGYKMAVEGKIRAREVRVDQDNWPDYVFKDDYDLPSLEEIQNHIQDKGHLPNIPSAKEVQENGIELGEMNKLLLEKIEELTLYILEFKKENDAFKTRLEELESKEQPNNQ